MKSALRFHASTTLGTAAASALLAAFALTVSGCSGAGGDDLVTTPSASSTVEEAASTSSTATVSQRETTTAASSDKAEPAAKAEARDEAGSDTAASNDTSETTARSAQAQTSPRGGNRPASASSTQTPSTTAQQPATDAPAADASDSDESAPAPVHSDTMRISGNQLLDSCGQRFVVRGVEQILGEQLPEGNDWLGLVQQIASTGANSVRILPGVNTLTLDNIDEILSFVGQQGMVAFIDPLNSDGDWYARADVKAMLTKHQSYLIIDAYGEPQYDDIDKWQTEAKAALVHMRALGYTVPLTVYANQFGRALPALFDFGADILAADPLHNTFLGWQAYWGNTGYYQDTYGYSLSEAVDAIVASGLPIQMGLDHITDLPSTEADYGTLMTAAQSNSVGWLWWDFYNPYGAENNLTEDGTRDHLTSTGAAVLQSHPASIANTARRACGH